MASEPVGGHPGRGPGPISGLLARARATAARWRRGGAPARGRGEPLGQGVWRRAHDRFLRAVDRYHQVMAGVPAGAARDHLEREGTRLAAALDAVGETCVAAQRAHPSAGFDVPGAPGPTAGSGSVRGAVDPRDLHRRLSRAAGLAAQAAEAAAMVRVAATGEAAHDVLGERLQAVTRSVDRTLDELG